MAEQPTPPVTKARAIDVRRRCKTLIDGLVALRPKKRPNTVAWIVVAGVLYVFVSLASDRSVREAVSAPSPSVANADVVLRRPPPVRQIAPIRALAIAPMAPPPITTEPKAKPEPKAHPHRRAKKKNHR